MLPSIQAFITRLIQALAQGVEQAFTPAFSQALKLGFSP